MDAVSDIQSRTPESIKKLIARHVGLAHAQTGIHNMQNAWKMEFFAFRDGPE